MRLLDKLKQKRDFHSAQATKFADLIAVLEEDEDVKKMVHNGKLSVINGAKAHFDATATVATAPEKKKRRTTWTPKQRKAAGLRMKKMWKKQRAKMLAGTKRGIAKRYGHTESAAATT